MDWARLSKGGSEEEEHPTSTRPCLQRRMNMNSSDCYVTSHTKRQVHGIGARGVYVMRKMEAEERIWLRCAVMRMYAVFGWIVLDNLYKHGANIDDKHSGFIWSMLAVKASFNVSVTNQKCCNAGCFGIHLLWTTCKASKSVIENIHGIRCVDSTREGVEYKYWEMKQILGVNAGKDLNTEGDGKYNSEGIYFIKASIHMYIQGRCC